MLINRARKILVTLAALCCLGLTTGYMFWPRSPLHLGQDDNMSASRLRADWDRGAVVVLVRHAERCDRSSNPCLGPEDGITTLGSQVSTEVGRSLKDLGLDRTDIISSRATRTEQTALYMFGYPVQTQEWLSDCEQFMLDEVAAHKASNRNLILITHRGCMSHLESRQGYWDADSSEYNSALFLSLDDHQKLKVQGVLNPDEWERLPKR